MKLKYLFILLLLAVTFSTLGCGNGGAGLNGAVTVTATTTGSVITATATYTNTSKTNLIGVPINFSAQIGNQLFDLGTFNTNNSGTVVLAFTPPTFSGSQTITVIAKSDNLSGFASVTMTGTSLTVTPPAAVTLTTALASGTAVPFQIAPASSFVSVTNPFTNDISNHLITVTATATASNSADTLSTTTFTTTTGSSGTAPFPGITGTLTVPSAVGGVDTMSITWTVTDTVTGQTGSGVTTVTLTKTS